MISLEDLIGIPHYEIIDIEKRGGQVRIKARYTGPRACPKCQGTKLRNKGVVRRWIRHASWAAQQVWLDLIGCRWLCKGCGCQFRERFPGVLRCQRASEAFRLKVFQDHWDGISRSRVARREGIGSATVERHSEHFLYRLAAERSGASCPQVLGIDEHFFSRKQGYATTFCDLKNHTVYDVTLGRSEAALAPYLNRLPGKHLVRVVCMDLASSYRALVRKHFPNAVIVADRFHVIRLVNHHFLSLWRQLDPVGAKNRGLLSLMRRHSFNLSGEQLDRLAAYLGQHPALDAVYQFKQRLCSLLLNKHKTAQRCRKLAPRLLQAIDQLRNSAFATLQTLGETMASWAEEIARMWRFTRNNAITEGFIPKWKSYKGKLTAFVTSTTIGSELRYCVLRSALEARLPPYLA